MKTSTTPTRLALTTAVLTLLAGIGSAQATITVYDNKATFLTDTAATSATGPLPNLGPLAVGANFTAGTVTLAFLPPAFQFYVGTAGTGWPDWSSRLVGNEIAISGTEDLDVTLAAPVGALGFDFVEPEFDPNANAPFVDSTFHVTLLNGVTSVGSFNFNAANDIAAFVGVRSTAAFNRVQIRELTALSGGENEFYGEFYTAPAPVPEPETYALMLAGLGLVGFAARRRATSSF